MNNNLLTTKDVATRLNISLRHTYFLLRKGYLRSVRLGRFIRVRPDDLKKFIAANLSQDPDSSLKTKIAHGGAKLENNQVTKSSKKVTHV